MGFQLRLRSSAVLSNAKSAATALYDHSLLQSFSVQPTLLTYQCRGPRIKSQMCSGDRGIEPRTLRTSSRVCVTTRPPRSHNICILIRICYNLYLFPLPNDERTRSTQLGGQFILIKHCAYFRIFLACISCGGTGAVEVSWLVECRRQAI